MSFELLIRPRGKPGNKLGVSVQKGPATVTFCFGEELAKTLDWKSGDKVNIYTGSDADFGKMRFVKQSTGEYMLGCLSQNSKTLKLTRRNVPGLPEGTFARTSMDHLLLDDMSGVEAELPKLGEFKQTQVVKSRVPVTPIVSAITPPAPVKPISIFDHSVKEPSEPPKQLTDGYNKRCPSCNKVFETKNLRRTHCESCAPVARA